MAFGNRSAKAAKTAAPQSGETFDWDSAVNRQGTLTVSLADGKVKAMKDGGVRFDHYGRAGSYAPTVKVFARTVADERSLADVLAKLGNLALAEMTDNGERVRRTAGEEYTSHDYKDDWGDGDNIVVQLPQPHAANVKRIRITN